MTSAEVTIFPSLLARFSSLQGLCDLVWGLQGGLGPKEQVLGQELSFLSLSFTFQRSRKARSFLPAFAI